MKNIKIKTYNKIKKKFFFNSKIKESIFLLTKKKTL